MGTLEKFNKDREHALLSMDKETILTYAEKYQMNIPKDDFPFWIAVHLARTAVETLPMFERAASKRWLVYHGLAAWDDGSVMPPEEKSELIKYYQRCEDFMGDVNGPGVNPDVP